MPSSTTLDTNEVSEPKVQQKFNNIVHINEKNDSVSESQTIVKSTTCIGSEATPSNKTGKVRQFYSHHLQSVPNSTNIYVLKQTL